jgi:hypothetical protein
MMFLAFVYLFVGVAHTISCVDEVDLSATSADGPHDGTSKKSIPVAGHCDLCAPILMPALAPVPAPWAQPAKLAFLPPRLVLLEDHPRLDTPPPKHLI